MNHGKLLLVALTIGVSSALGAQELSWQINPKPTLVLGDAQGDANVLFGAGLVGATRLRDGRILVADRADFSLKLFASDGKFLKRLGRKGAGPGEFDYLARMFHCGDQVVAYDIDGYRISVFDADVKFVRSFRFGSPQPGHPPYASACNSAGTFVHYGWIDRKDYKGGIHRGVVPIWISGLDSVVRKTIGSMPGSERWGTVVDNQLRGTRPLPLGKQPVIAIGVDRIYAGSADAYEIAVYDFEGRRIGTIRKPGADLAVTKSDIDGALERETAGQSDADQKRAATSFATIEFPKTLPAYIKMLVDSEGQLWVQDYPRAKSATSRWTVFSPTGAQQAEVMLPAHLEVYEIGRDYVLGKYIDPGEQIPEVRMYRLRRGGRP